MKKIKNNLYNVGVDDLEIDLFEGQYIVPDGMSYNSYLLLGDKVAVTDTVDARFCDEWLKNINDALAGRQPDYLIIHHMEPDHSSCIDKFVSKYPNAKVVGNIKTFTIMEQFFGKIFDNCKLVVKDSDTLDLGGYNLKFVFTPMVHWPEVMMSFDITSGILFSADAFGRFGSSKATDIWDDEARRYYIGIVGKYGVQVQNTLKKASTLPITMICPLHGPVLTEDIGHALELYDAWSSYRPEKQGVLIAYTSVYGNTQKASLKLLKKLSSLGA